MSKNWTKDMNKLHGKYGITEVVKNMDPEKLKKFLEFRINCLQEELDELKNAKSNDERVDALIDLSVFAIGTLDLFEVDTYKAWNKVYKANMKKQVGIKDSRPNPLGLPDLIKPKRWRAPHHHDNVGLLGKISE